MSGQKNHGSAGDALRTLAAQLRAEDTPISPHVVDPDTPPELGELAGGGEYAVVVESVYEGYLCHYGDPRILAGQDPDLALLAGDYLYALGLARLATIGDTRAVKILADLISECARLQAEGEADSISALWRDAVKNISAGQR